MTEQLGEKVRRLRIEHGMSQTDLARATELKQGGISDIERGKIRQPHPRTLRRLADSLDVQIKDLLD